MKIIAGHAFRETRLHLYTNIDADYVVCLYGRERWGYLWEIYVRMPGGQLHRVVASTSHFSAGALSYPTAEDAFADALAQFERRSLE